MLEELRKAPNLLTAVRFILVPVLWVFAFLGFREYIGLGILIGGLTDALDGFVARRMKLVSDFGSKFDSIADQFLQLSAIVWIFMLQPEVFSENPLLSLMALVTYLLSLLVGLVKFKRIANLHLYLSKVVGVFLFLFIVHTFIVGQYNKILFMLACVGFILSSAETLVLQLISNSVDEHIGSLFFLYLAKDHPIRNLPWFEPVSPETSIRRQSDKSISS
jgi:phosphatidylglycerophosphate synthase